MEISYKLDNFEGPLDLLLHLIEKNKVSIYDIPIVLITEQYLEYVNQMDHEDLDVVSDFLVMAATLLDIKSRMLLPKVEKEEEEDEEDPRASWCAGCWSIRCINIWRRSWKSGSRRQSFSFLRNRRFPGRWRNMKNRWIWTSFWMV